MKRIGTVALSFLAVGCLLNGCALGDAAQMDGAVQNSDFAKAQEITAVRVGEDVPVYTATEKEHIETFVEQDSPGGRRSKCGLFLSAGEDRSIWGIEHGRQYG